MTGYPERIEAARADVEALQGDAQELQRLHDERAAHLDELKVSGSRDFARMAEVEGQRAALATMYADQGAEVQRARAALVALEQEAARDGKLARIGEIAEEIGEIRDQLYAGVDGLKAHLAAELSRLIALDTRWTFLRPEWVREARALGFDLNPTQAATDAVTPLYEELERRGVDVTALRVSRPHMDRIAGGLLDHKTLPYPSDHLEHADFEPRLHNLVLALYNGAFLARALANTYAPTEGQA
ncbi:hypothetical protein V3W47_10770 [Deinococcus sp. YIM 134068]|uniref:hypothetical protein n=1 Tax=Deinococcus lichenicola TaxID=3118910 RepID=UPI002F95085F